MIMYGNIQNMKIVMILMLTTTTFAFKFPYIDDKEQW